MPILLQRYATPFVTGLFLISVISGVGLFFHFGPSGFRGMHEWLSIVLIVPFVLHVWKNWRPMVAYLRKTPMAIALAASAVMSGAFLVPMGTSGEQAGGPPQFALAHTVMTHSPNTVAPLFGTTPDALTQKLTAAGFVVSSPDAPLTDIAAASGKSEADLAALLNQAAS